MLTEKELLSAAKKYLKIRYLETTVSMNILENKVVHGTGTLKVNCTVKFLGLFSSDWTKTFIFKNKNIVSMDAWRR